jgi:hypothetical protein
VDPTLFKYAGLYWLMFTLQDDGAAGSLKLYAYHAPSLDAEFAPHVNNPIKCDIGGSRPAGAPLLVDGELYRPSQDCSSTYGGAVVIQRILTLSPSEFEEVEVLRIEPPAGGAYPAGLHTLNPCGTGALIDGKKLRFDVRGWKKNWDVRRELFK